jgi:pimeloyl-ACP methyl ester carboxylesterase
MFEGFEQTMIDTGEAVIRVRHGGNGPPALLLHGIPQTHVMWHKIAPHLARDFTVVATDLRGYGDSSKPPSTPDHAPYSKRAMARDQIEVMRQLGFDRFFVAGHDRGARCAYRMALDHPERVLKLALLDIVPTGEVFRRVDMKLGLAFWVWFLLAQPYDLPERVVGADPQLFLDYMLDHWSGARVRSRKRCAPSMHGRSATPRPCTRSARSTERRPRWITSMTRPTEAGYASRAPSSCCGADGAFCRRGMTCLPFGGSGRTTSADAPSIAVTSSPKKRRMRPTQHFTPFSRPNGCSRSQSYLSSPILTSNS